MTLIRQQEVTGDRTEGKYAREVKHLVAPWTVGASKLWMGISVIDPGSASNPHAHEQQEEAFFCLSGSGLIRVGDETFDVSPGSCVFVPPGTTHQLVNTDPDGVLHVLCATAPPFDRDGWTDVHE